MGVCGSYPISPSGQGDVRIGLGNVPRLEGLEPAQRGLAARLLQQGHEVREGNRGRLAQVVHPVPGGALIAPRTPGDDVVDVGVVPQGRAVAVQVDVLPLEDPPRELVDRHLRALPGSVHGEEPQGDHVHAVQVAVRVADEAPRPSSSPRTGSRGDPRSRTRRTGPSGCLRRRTKRRRTAPFGPSVRGPIRAPGPYR